MAERPVSPQDKKRLSRERDGRNVYGENNKASRKAIPAFKRRSAREERRGVAALLGQLEGRDGEGAESVSELIDAPLSDHANRLPEKLKVPDAPLELILNGKGIDENGQSDDDLPRRGRRDAVQRELSVYNGMRRKQARNGEGA